MTSEFLTSFLEAATSCCCSGNVVVDVDVVVDVVVVVVVVVVDVVVVVVVLVLVVLLLLLLLIVVVMLSRVGVSGVKLNEDQMKIVDYVRTKKHHLAAPLVVYGAFGTGKTESLAQSAVFLASSNTDVKLLICTQTNS